MSKTEAQKAAARYVARLAPWALTKAVAELLGVDPSDVVMRDAKHLERAKQNEAEQFAIVKALDTPAALKARRQEVTPAYMAAALKSAKATSLEKAKEHAPRVTPAQIANIELEQERDTLGALHTVTENLRASLLALIMLDQPHLDAAGVAFVELVGWQPEESTTVLEAAAIEGRRDAIKAVLKPWVAMHIGHQAQGFAPTDVRAIRRRATDAIDAGQWPNFNAILGQVEVDTRRSQAEQRAQDYERRLEAIAKEISERPGLLADKQRKAWNEQTRPTLVTEAEEITGKLAELEQQLTAAGA